MEPLLKTLAREYSKRYKDLKGLCFLFPNKRCGIYLKKYFAEYDIHTEDLPHFHTISSFTGQLARKSEAPKIEQLFTLYDAYLELLKIDSGEDSIIEFDNFRIWGEIVLSDFNTVDLNLVDVNEIFKNVKDYREITSNFLTEDQKEVMREYFGIEPDEDEGSFWKIFDNPNESSKLKSKFLSLWQILAPLHDLFIEKLSINGFGTTGSIFRTATKTIKERGRSVLPYKKIVVVGFNALTESERIIFKELKNEEGYPGYDEFVDFIWDSYGPILESNDFSASKFVDSNRKHFPQPDWLNQIIQINHDLNSEWKDFPDIKIISAPSNTSQTKVAGEILKDYTDSKGKELVKNADIALILPDESLLSNVLFSVPDDIADINLTMGLSLRHSPVAGFLSLLRRLYVSMREKGDERIFYTKDLKLLFSHPYSYILFKSEAIQNIFDYIDQNHFVAISNRDIKNIIPDSEEFLKFPSKKSSAVEIFLYLETLLKEILNHIVATDETTVNKNDEEYLSIYLEYLKYLKEAVEKFNINGSALSMFSLILKLVANEKIGFEGEPLTGLQIMGTLETRCLDFKHLVVLSMNEGVIPRKAFASTFIPEALRKVYGLPPARYAEEIFGYYFFRLISRADSVTLIYDGRVVSGMRNGESRYLLQLRQYLPKNKIKEENWQYRLQNRQNQTQSIEKNEEIINIINLFSSDKENRKNFSASTLNTYRECEMKFFLQNILNINSDPEKSEYPDAITIGNILHDVMLRLYLPEKDHGKFLKQPKIIDSQTIASLLENKELIRSIVMQSIKNIYYGNKDGSKPDVESGVTFLIAEQIEELVNIILNYDFKLTPFKLYGCEIKQKIKFKLSSGREVNFNFAIDRLDEIEVDGKSQIRIVDYKTGRLKLESKNLEEVFAGGYNNEQIFQLFTYAWLLGKIGFNGWENVITEIYFIPALSKDERQRPRFDKIEVESFREYAHEFNERMESMIEDIFTKKYFECSNKSAVCTYCTFKNICGV